MFFRNYSQRFWERRQAGVERLVKLDSIPLKAPEVFAFLVRLAVAPAAPKNAQPLESHHSDGGPTTFSFAQLVLVKQAGPLTLRDGTFSELDDALMIEDRTRIAELNDPLASTLLFDGRHATETEQVIGRLEVSANRPESGCQSRSQRRATAWQLLEKPGFSVLGEDRLDTRVVLLDRLMESAQLLNQSLHFQLQRLNQRRILSQGRRLFQGIQALADSVLRTAVMSVEERAQRSGFGGLELGQIGPTAQEFQGHQRGKILTEHLQSRRVIALKGGTQAVAQAGAIIHKPPPRLHQQAQLPGRHILNGQHAQPIGMHTNQLAQQIGVQRIILGPTDFECATVVGQTARINRIKRQEVVLHERIEDRPAALFNGHRDAAFWVLLAQLEKPRIQRLRFMLHQMPAGRRTHGVAHHQTVFLVSPIQANPAHDRCCRLSCLSRISLYHFFVHSIFPIASRKALDARRPYRGPSYRRPLRIRFGPKRGAGSESLSQCIVIQGQGNSSSQLCVTPLWEAKNQLFTSQNFRRAKVIHNRLRGEEPGLSSPSVNNFWSYYKGRSQEKWAGNHAGYAEIAMRPIFAF